MFFLSNVYECCYCGSDTAGPGVIAGTVIWVPCLYVRALQLDDVDGVPAHKTFKCVVCLPLDKLFAILADAIFKCVFMNEKLRILI